MSRLPKRAGRTIFDEDPAAYDAARLPYPARLWEILSTRCGLARGRSVFEVGPGTGIATRELLRRGASPLVLVEPSRPLRRYLRRRLGPLPSRVRWVAAPFEAARLPPATFDLGVAATSFHWVAHERRALARAARALRPGGWWAYWHQFHGDPDRPSEFHRAIQPLYGRRSLRRRSGSSRVRRHIDERRRALHRVGEFDSVSAYVLRERWTLPTREVVALWSTFSDLARRGIPAQRRFLQALAAIVDRELGGHARFTSVVVLVIARKRPLPPGPRATGSGAMRYGTRRDVRARAHEEDDIELCPRTKPRARRRTRKSRRERPK